MVHHARNSCTFVVSKRPYEPASTLHKRVVIACEQGSEESQDTTPKLAPAAKVIIIVVLFISIVALLPIFEYASIPHCAIGESFEIEQCSFVRLDKKNVRCNIPNCTVRSGLTFAGKYGLTQLQQHADGHQRRTLDDQAAPNAAVAAASAAITILDQHKMRRALTSESRTASPTRSQSVFSHK